MGHLFPPVPLPPRPLPEGSAANPRGRRTGTLGPACPNRIVFQGHICGGISPCKNGQRRGGAGLTSQPACAPPGAGVREKAEGTRPLCSGPTSLLGRGQKSCRVQQGGPGPGIPGGPPSRRARVAGRTVLLKKPALPRESPLRVWRGVHPPNRNREGTGAVPAAAGSAETADE